MNTKIKAILVLVMSLVIASCGQKQLIEATPTFTPNSTSISTQTSTPLPSPTSTPIPNEYQTISVPRLLLIGEESTNLEILGTKWDYFEDNFLGEDYACRLYSRKDGSDTYAIKQCDVLSQGTNNFENQVAGFMNNGYESLTPKNTTSNFDNISLLGKKNTTAPYDYAVIIDADKYFMVINVLIKIGDNSSLQSVYESHAADIIDYVIEEINQKFATVTLTGLNLPPSTTIIVDTKDVSQSNTTLNPAKGHIEGNISWYPQPPIENVVIQIYEAGSSTPKLETKTDAKGYYKFVNIEPTEYGFGITVVIPSNEKVCTSPEVLFDVDLEWFHYARDYNNSNGWIDIWQSINLAKIEAGKIIYVDAILKCP